VQQMLDDMEDLLRDLQASDLPLCAAEMSHRASEIRQQRLTLEAASPAVVLRQSRGGAQAGPAARGASSVSEEAIMDSIISGLMSRSSKRSGSTKSGVDRFTLPAQVLVSRSGVRSLASRMHDRRAMVIGGRHAELMLQERSQTNAGIAAVLRRSRERLVKTRIDLAAHTAHDLSQPAASHLLSILRDSVTVRLKTNALMAGAVHEGYEATAVDTATDLASLVEPADD
jgi:hypothetical protein